MEGSKMFEDDTVKALAGLLTEELNYIFSETLTSPPKLVVYGVKNSENEYDLEVVFADAGELSEDNAVRVLSWAGDWVQDRIKKTK